MSVMSRHLPWLLWCPLVVLCVLGTPATAVAQGEPVKPYIVFIVDNSGSMTASTGFGPPSCPGAADNRMDHAKCAIQNIANSYGDMVVALARFRMTSADTNCGDGCGDLSSTNCEPCSGTVGDPDCTPALRSADQFQLLVPLVDGAQSDLVNWTDFSCGQCTTGGAEPELFAYTWTPLAGSLTGARRYWQGSDPEWQSGATGSDPIDEDPLNTVFTSPGNQCRPYITVLLTDGAETCAEFDRDTVPAAAALLSTPVNIGTAMTPDVRNYRIQMKPIGFGISPGNAQIEALAHAGGETNDNDPTTREGAYAQNEEELQLEISQIIADAIKFEKCNNADDDCDILVDEDFPELTDACDNGLLGVCRRTGTYQCNGTQTGTTCNLGPPGGTSGDETCDGEDDDCDGFVDEGVCVGCGTVELCNNIDDNCRDGVDEGLFQPCGTDVGECSPGTETCQAGVWVGCDADFGGPEECNALDDDCDGTVNGFPESCTALAPPAQNPNIGPCHPGTHICLTDGSGGYGPCTGEVLPEPEVCDTIDNDCNGVVDEGTGGADCSTTCGIGVTECVDGTLECSSMEDIDDETCNNIDDNCNGEIDEDAPSMGSCDDGGAICNGELRCLGGSYVCVGEGVEPETCNCEDDNCNDLVDDGKLCGDDATCVHPSQAGFDCQCAQACAGGEFPCPIGRVCIDDFCLVDPCAGVSCTPDGSGNLTECIGGECVAVCGGSVTCQAPLICFGPTGDCRPDDCTTFPDRCEADELCAGGACVSDPCTQVSCDGVEYCFAGDCVPSCAGIDCPAGQRCEFGACQLDQCGGTCPGSDICHEASGECRPNPCPNQMCPGGLLCNPQNGVCEQDPCLGVICPTDDQICRGGSCFSPDDLVDAGVDADTENQLITTGGGGGCQAEGRGGVAVALLVLALALVARRRTRREVAS